ncbi:MAG: hypothetical protein LQ352_003777 [Teloschistes flavicans]|nr:MAG: hypothetical protein LQ352_003777 [Teloschistes flavicans]
MTSGTGETYMLPRDTQESQRLDAQHEYFRQISYGHLIHPSIPARQLHAVADVATGTGVWLRQLADDPTVPRPVQGQESSFVGFDISRQQFPAAESLPPHVKFVVHDMVEAFPAEYHQRFDLVNVRLVSYAIKGSDLDRVVRNITQLLKPGGYLQWQEADASDSWAHPETQTATSCINYVVAEKVDRGLLPGIAGPLVKSILSLPATIPEGYQNPISWSKDLMRLIHLETVSTLDHPFPAVGAGKKMAIMSSANVLLMARISRKSGELDGESSASRMAEKLREEIKSMNETLEAIQRGSDMVSSWDFDVTWIVARKAIPVEVKNGWMSVKKPGA